MAAFITYVAASYPLLWVDSCEYSRVIKSFSDEVNAKLSYRIYEWDIISGVTQNGNTVKESEDDPAKPIDFLINEKEENNIIFVKDYHIFLKGPEIWRKLLNAVPIFKQRSNIFVVISPVVEIPVEIKRYFSVIDFDLPTKQELEAMLDNIMKEYDAVVENKNEVITSGTGLTAFEFENAVYHSMVANKKKILPSYIHQQKKQLIMKNSAMNVVKPEFGFERVAGLDNLKQFLVKMVGKPNSKGTLVLGVPGSGKSLIAKALGKETGRLSISLDIGNLQGGIVGETEQKTKDALKTIDAMEPAILLLEEIEKSLAGVGSSYSGDSGTSKRQGAQILNWLNDHKSDVYVIATCNSIDNLPPEYTRSGRWDAIFFVGLPTAEEREKLCELYKNMYEVDDDDIPDIAGWTGAEIDNMYKLAKNLEVPLKKAANYVCPIIKTQKDKIDDLVNRMSGITVPASKYINRKPVVDNTRKVREL